MNYELEELLPIVGRLAERYTGTDSTSVSYEKAEQLMGAVLYCMQEAELESSQAAAAQGTSARQMYEAGKAAVERKVKRALELYHKLLPEFSDYGSPYLADTVLKGMPKFFRWYNMEFEPQNTILTLDYPVLRDLSPYTGIDRIYEFLVCVDREQEFLKAFPQGMVRGLLRFRFGEEEDFADNVCEEVLLVMAMHILAGKPLGEKMLSEKDCLFVKSRLGEMELAEVKSHLLEALEKFTEAYCKNSGALFAYLENGVNNIAVRLKNSTCNFSSSVLE